uniref:Uncharacterized protein n=1 Tax=Ananas comosus var. bracteatus TaxID=296719 RepID=A0A6V7NJN1_ANACO|nr:unnamed protein product [Ananas comosus var. bracteatus]
MRPQDLLPSYDIFGAVKSGGGVGVVLVNAKAAGYSIVTDSYPLPTVQLSAAAGRAIIDYTLRSQLLASISFNGTVLGTPFAPSVAFFSSRGPNFQNGMLLKPDVAAPGLNILAAWPTQADGGNDGKKTFNIISGTSMATPHVSGIAALIKSVHPDWSPAAIKSAIITTSDVKDKQGLPIFNELQTPANVYELGAGHVNPSKAVDPVSRNVSCADEKQIAAEELNLPSIVFPIGLSPRPNVTRTVTNVGKAQSTYAVQLEVPVSVRVTVTPSTLSFSKVNEKKTFRALPASPSLEIPDLRTPVARAASLHLLLYFWNPGPLFLSSPSSPLLETPRLPRLWGETAAFLGFGEKTPPLSLRSLDFVLDPNKGISPFLCAITAVAFAFLCAITAFVAASFLYAISALVAASFCCAIRAFVATAFLCAIFALGAAAFLCEIRAFVAAAFLCAISALVAAAFLCAISALVGAAFISPQPLVEPYI